MKISKTIVAPSLLLSLSLAMTGCFTSKPDISGVWIPEHTPKSTFSMITM